MKELEDFSWFPDSFRQEQSEFIGDLAVFTKIYNPFIAYLKEQTFKTTQLHDLCAGSGTPGYFIYKQSEKFNTLVFSDKFHIERHFNNELYQSKANDVLNTTFNSNETYLMTNAFHHFDNIQQASIVNQLKRDKAEAFIIEILEPSFTTFLKILLAGTLGVLLLTPFISKMTWRKFLFTYILPINIFTVTFDGLISVIKSKTASQYREQFKQEENIVVKEFQNIAGKSILIHIKK